MSNHDLREHVTQIRVDEHWLRKFAGAAFLLAGASYITLSVILAVCPMVGYPRAAQEFLRALTDTEF